MGDVPAGTSAATRAQLVVPPAALPELIVAHDKAITDVEKLMSSVTNTGRIAEPWTHDPIARDITARFNTYAIDGATSAYNCIRLYHGELQRVADTLRAMHAAYQAGEDGNATAMGAL